MCRAALQQENTQLVKEEAGMKPTSSSFIGRAIPSRHQSHHQNLRFTQAGLSQCNPDCTLTVEEILVNDTLLQNLLCKQEQIVRRKPSNRKTAPGETLRGITSSKSSKSISRPCAACINRRSARNYALGSCLREGNRRRLPACYLQTTGRLSSMI